MNGFRPRKRLEGEWPMLEFVLSRTSASFEMLGLECFDRMSTRIRCCRPAGRRRSVEFEFEYDAVCPRPGDLEGDEAGAAAGWLLDLERFAPRVAERDGPLDLRAEVHLPEIVEEGRSSRVQD